VVGGLYDGVSGLVRSNSCIFGAESG